MFHLATVIKFFSNYRYLALFPLACIEGPIVALGAGFMVHSGYLLVIPAFLVMLLGDFIPDSIYYFIGRFGNKEKLLKKYDTKSGLVSRHFGYIEKAWQEHTTKTMFVCKLAYGFSIPLLILAGFTRVSYIQFVWRSLVVTLFQYGLLMLVGYYLGQSYQSAIPYVKDVGIIIAIVAIIFIFLYFLVQRYMKNKVIKIIEKE